MPTPLNCQPGSTIVAAACATADMCSQLDGQLSGDSACMSLGCCSVSACVWSAWASCSCPVGAASGTSGNATRSRSRNMVALPTFWPPLPSCPMLSEDKPCVCDPASSSSTGGGSTGVDSGLATVDLNVQLAAAVARANTNEALFIAFLVLLLVSWCAIVLILYKQRQQRAAAAAAAVNSIALSSAASSASPSGVDSAGHTFNARTTSVAHYDHTPPPPGFGSETGTYAAPSLSSTDSTYSEAPRGSKPTNMYVPVTRAASRAPTLTSVPSSGGDDQYVDVPRYDASAAGRGAPITTYVPVPRANANLSPRRPTAGLPPPLVTDHFT